MRLMRSITLAALTAAAVFTLIGCGASAQRDNSFRDAGSASLSEESAEISAEAKAGDFLVSGQPVYEYETQELWAGRDGNRIYGVIYIPQNAGTQMPAIIYSHGFGGSHRYGIQYAEAMAARGYVVYCFDFCGGSPGSRSDGSTLEMSLFTEQADLEAVMDMVRSLDYVDSDNLFLLGTSQGGAVSAITGAAHPGEVKGMILLYPAFIMVDRANELFQSPEEIPDTYYFMWMDVGRSYFEALLDYDIYGAIAAYDRDVLLIHGDADGIVPLESSERAVEAYASADLKVIPGAGHGFGGEDVRTAVDYMTEYCNSHVN